MVISNKTIFMVLSIALLISVFGTFVNFGRIYNLSLTGLAGAATSSAVGDSIVTIAQVTSITNNFQTIQFGTGYVNSTCSTCNMDSNGSGNFQCCGTFNWTSTTGPNIYGFLLENTGNVNLSVNYTCVGSCTAASFIGGTNPAFQIRTTNNSDAHQTGEQGAADTLGVCDGEGKQGVPAGGPHSLNFTTYKEVTAAGDWLCGNSTHFPLSFIETHDAFVIDLNVSIPEDAPIAAGTQAAFTFNALGAG